MHSKRGYRICICSVILGELESFRNYKGFSNVLVFQHFKHLNDFCREYDSQERSASEVKQEIERHLKDKETLENSLPSSIVIGPYWISTEGVRQALAKKRKALANAVIDLLAKKLRKQADMVCDVAFCFIQ